MVDSCSVIVGYAQGASDEGAVLDRTRHAVVEAVTACGGSSFGTVLFRLLSALWLPLGLYGFEMAYKLRGYPSAEGSI